MTRQTELRAMIAQYSAELADAWRTGLSVGQVQRLSRALDGAVECLSLLQKGPPRGRDVVAARERRRTLEHAS